MMEGRSSAPERKIFAGPRLRRLRSSLGLTQSAMADALGVSVSYMNLIERNQRPLSAQFLLRMADVFDVDFRQLVGDDGGRSVTEVAEILNDPVLRNLAVTRAEMQDFVDTSPTVADALARLYAAYRQKSAAAEGDAAPRMPIDDGPLERVRDLVQDRRNHFDDLDRRAEELAEELRLAPGDLFSAISDRLRVKHGLAVRIMPADVMPQSVRRLDYHRRQVQISELLDASSRTFQAAYQLALSEAGAAIEAEVTSAGNDDDSFKRLLRVNLANYFAAAVMMPYGRFHTEAEALGYDIELLAAKFGGGFEQVCHRLTTLQRTGARGVPFFLVRVDEAGNVSKRFAAGRFAFARYGGSCPLWSLHATFRTPGEVLTEVVELPDGTRYLSIARTVKSYRMPWGERSPRFAIGLGCDLKHARHLVYSRNIDLDNPRATPIGTNCLLCERTDCRQRSQLPAGRELVVDLRSKGLTPFQFSNP